MILYKEEQNAFILWQRANNQFINMSEEEKNKDQSQWEYDILTEMRQKVRNRKSEIFQLCKYKYSN